MTNDANDDTQPVDIAKWSETAPRYSEIKRMISVFVGRPLPVIGLVIIVLLILVAIFAPLLAPDPPNQMEIINKLQQPSSEHWLGTDSLGRDTLSRIIFGSRTSLIIGISVTAISSIIGIVLGLLAAYFGGAIYHIIMRFMDALMAFPMLLLALLVASLLGAGMLNIIIALGIGMIAAPCRLMCGVVMSVKQNDYVLSARAMGMSNLRIMFQEILPNAFPPLLVLMTIGIGAVILAEAGLSFLGIGITPPTATWGGMVNDGYKFIMTNPVLAISPGVAIMLVVFGFNMLGDGLRDALDPKLRGVI
ncbi:MAG: ABC transporter permease [Chloroflexi bacterium RBG_13_51_18]|nr:MAG: ABC transporter permease [Chloroflexi bacterium RBG_13_51_18]